MDEARFDAWTRDLSPTVGRRGLLYRLAAGIAAAAVGVAGPPGEADAGKKQRKRKKRCRKKPNRTLCGKKCVRGTCCNERPCGENCTCDRAIEGDTYCAANGIVECSVGLCANSDECGAGSRCVEISDNPSVTCCRSKC